MKTIYSKPVTEFVDLTLNGDVLLDLPMTKGSIVTDGMNANSSSFEEAEDDDWSASSNKSLWED